MTRPDDPSPRPPLMQRLYDSPFLLLALGIVVMAVFYTLWGVLELIRLPAANLP